MILRHRSLGKLLNTYVSNLIQHADENDRVHSTLVQNGTTTGRFSSKDPNLQNIPIKNEEGQKVRNTFIAPAGHKLLALDYSQIELRIAAILSNDSELIKIFKNDRDIHTETAARVFEKDSEHVDKEERRKAKMINFAILYGMGANALRSNLGSGTTREEAGHYLEQYFKTFSGLASWIDAIKNETKRTGYTVTMFGRRRYFPDINSRVPFVRTHAERAAVNAPIQGTQADLIKIAMIRSVNWIEKQKLESKAKLILQIHDELVFEVDDEKVNKVADGIKVIMESILDKDQTRGVPIKTGVAVGERLGGLE